MNRIPCSDTPDRKPTVTQRANRTPTVAHGACISTSRAVHLRALCPGASTPCTARPAVARYTYVHVRPLRCTRLLRRVPARCAKHAALLPAGPMPAREFCVLRYCRKFNEFAGRASLSFITGNRTSCLCRPVILPNSIYCKTFGEWFRQVGACMAGVGLLPYVMSRDPGFFGFITPIRCARLGWLSVT
jgi:hypothetical protein